MFYISWYINNSEEELLSIAITDSCTPAALVITPENDVYKVVQQPTPTPEPEPIDCGNLAMKIEINGEKYCMTKYNIRDKTELPTSSENCSGSIVEDNSRNGCYPHDIWASGTESTLQYYALYSGGFQQNQDPITRAHLARCVSDL